MGIWCSCYLCHRLGRVKGTPHLGFCTLAELVLKYGLGEVLDAFTNYHGTSSSYLSCQNLVQSQILCAHTLHHCQHSAWHCDRSGLQTLLIDVEQLSLD